MGAKAAAYLSGNQISALTTVTVSTEDTAHPKENAYDKIMSKVFRWNVGTGGTYEVDRGASAGSYDTIQIANHNFVDSATIQIKAGASASPTTVIKTITWTEKYLTVLFSPARTERHVQLSVTDAQDGSTKSEFGEFIIGTRTVLPMSFRPGHTPGKRGADIIQETLGQLWHWNRQRQRRIWDLVFRIKNNTDKDIFEAWFDATNGRQDPFIWIPDVSVEESWYVRRAAHQWMPRELQEALNAYDEQIVLIEEAQGINLT